MWGLEGQEVGNVASEGKCGKFGVQKSKKWAILGLGRLKMGNLGFIGVENENLGAPKGRNGEFGAWGKKKEWILGVGKNQKRAIVGSEGQKWAILGLEGQKMGNLGLRRTKNGEFGV